MSVTAVHMSVIMAPEIVALALDAHQHSVGHDQEGLGLVLTPSSSLESPVQALWPSPACLEIP